MTTKRKGVYAHLELLDARDWGLIVYDEVHLLPAPIFRMTANLQARRRLGLTATLVREDGREGDVFSLIGPKRYDAPWKDIEAQGWIAPADCVEVRVTMSPSRADGLRDRRARRALPAGRVHAGQDPRRRAARREARRRADAGDRAVPRPARRARPTDLDAPVIKGETPVKERQRLFEAFRAGEIKLLVVSQGRQLLHRPARGRGGDPGVGLLRLAPGGGPAPRPPAPAQERRPHGPLLRRRGPRHRRRRLRRRTVSGSWPSRATPTGSPTPTTCSPEAARRTRAPRGYLRKRAGLDARRRDVSGSLTLTPEGHLGALPPMRKEIRQ